jgi:lambda family phage minor tail protein L
MPDLIDTVQLQEIDDSLVELFDFTLPSGTKVYIFNGLDDGTTNIYFPQKTLDGGNYPLHEYIALPIELEGIGIDGAGPMARPTLRTANIPTLTRSISNNSDGVDDETTLISILEDENLFKNEDLLGTKLTYRRTLFSNVFSSAGTSASAPVEFPSQTYYLDRVSAETNILVEFELASPMDVEGVTLPARVVVGKYCMWKYQGYNLDQEGACIWPLNSNGIFFDEEDNLITRDIATISAWSNAATYNANDRVKTTTNNHTQIWEATRNVPVNKDPETNPFYWNRIDLCSKTLTGCKLRFQGNSTNAALNTSAPLPFGGFPGSKKFK